MAAAIPRPFRILPWRLIKNFSSEQLQRELFRILSDLSPSNTIVHFWPPVPPRVVAAVQEQGFITVREMINCFRGTAKNILDSVYSDLNINGSHNIDKESVDTEKSELALYDYIFASNAQVEQSLVEAGVRWSHILPSSFGWTPSKYRFSKSDAKDRPVTALFVGTIGVRKGIPFLLKAWSECGVDGEIVLAGSIDSEIQPIIDQYRDNPRIRFVDFISDLSGLYNSADFFVFPTLEEGGPQVVYEAAGAGLPILTTPMGAGRIVKDGQNGLIVPPADTHALASALRELATNPAKRLTLGARAAVDAQDFTYDKIGIRRRDQMLNLLKGRAEK